MARVTWAQPTVTLNGRKLVCDANYKIEHGESGCTISFCGIFRGPSWLRRIFMWYPRTLKKGVKVTIHYNPTRLSVNGSD